MEKLLALWFASPSLGIVLLDPVFNDQGELITFTVHRVNDCLVRLLGKSPGELAWQPTDSLLPFLSGDELLDRLCTVFRTHEPQHWPLPTEAGNGSVSVARQANQLVLVLQGMVDIHEPAGHQPIRTQPASSIESLTVHQQDKLLVESNQLLMAIIDTIPTGVALLRPICEEGTIVDFRYVISNPQSSQITGLSQEAMLGQALLDLFPHLLANGVFAKLVQVAMTGQSQQFQLLDDLPSGAFWGDFALVRVGQDVLFSVTDVTRLKRSKEELRQANQELQERVAQGNAQIQQLTALQRAILTHAHLGIIATDTQGVIQLVNPALEAMTGYRADELVGKLTPNALREPIHHQQQLNQLKRELDNPDLKEHEVVAAFVQKNHVLRRENILLTKDAQHKPVLSIVSGLYNDESQLIGFVDFTTDLSYLKSVEQALVRANEHNQLATQAGKLGLWEWNLVTNELTLDETFYKLAGVPSSTVITHMRHIEPLVHPHDLAFFDEKVQTVIREQKPFSIDFRIISPIDTSIRYMRAIGLSVKNESLLSQRMIGVVRDRTKKQHTDLALRTSEQRYRSLVNQLSVVVFLADQAGLCTYLNPAWEAVTDYSVDETLGRAFLDYIVSEDQERTQAYIGQILAGELTLANHVIRFHHKGGGFRWVEMVAQLDWNLQNEVVGISGTLTDITDRKQAEEALIESEQRFRQIAENVDEIFWIRDIQASRFLYINPAYEKFTGLSPQPLYEDSAAFLSIVLAEDRTIVERAFRDQDLNVTYQFRTFHQDGSLRWLRTKALGIKNEQGVLVRRIGIATDITPAIEKEQILQESLVNERLLNGLKSQFISIASHEFRTPLMSISSSTELVRYYVNREKENASTPLISKHLNAIVNQIAGLNDLINDTLVISKAEEGKIQVLLEDVDLVELSQLLTASTFTDREDGRKVELSVTGIARPVCIDRKLMTHVLSNLLSNAFKFSTGTVELGLTFSLTDVRIVVRDTGIGIPAKDLPHLFGKFFRASNAGHIQGTGLGLAICQEYMSLQQGALEVVSKEGVGTTFTAILP
jgi:PAS domain S-box-containing protein